MPCSAVDSALLAGNSGVARGEFEGFGLNSLKIFFGGTWIISFRVLWGLALFLLHGKQKYHERAWYMHGLDFHTFS